MINFYNHKKRLKNHVFAGPWFLTSLTYIYYNPGMTIFSRLRKFEVGPGEHFFERRLFFDTQSGFFAKKGGPKRPKKWRFYRKTRMKNAKVPNYRQTRKRPFFAFFAKRPRKNPISGGPGNQFFCVFCEK